MDPTLEPPQQALGQTMARGQNVSEQLLILEDMIHFLKMHAPEALAATEGDYYPVRKIVGRRPA